jgi:ADP-ribose pyrophosphatase
MEIIKTEVIARGMGGRNERCWLAMHERTVKSNNDERKYFFVTRGDVVVPPHKKTPDAVVIIAFVGEGDDMKLVLTDEYRLPIDRREIGTPAGLIDAEDYDCTPALLCGKNPSISNAACRAAVREFKEETGMDFVPCEHSPDNLYSTAGMTDESVFMVIGKASGTPSKEFLEEHEDINTMILGRKEIIELMNRHDLAFSKHVWPFLWAIKHFGFPQF